MKKLLIIGLLSTGYMMASDTKTGYLNEQEIDTIESIQNISKATDKLIGLEINNHQQIVNNSKELLKLKKENELLKKLIKKSTKTNISVAKAVKENPKKVTIDSKIYSNINNFINNK